MRITTREHRCHLDPRVRRAGDEAALGAAVFAAAESFGLTDDEIRDMSTRAMDFAFCDEDVKLNVLANIRNSTS